jgi:hypothetical protein
MVQLLPELFPRIAKYCDLITCISLASCDKSVRKEITSPSGLKTINTLKIFPKIESWQDFILKHNLEIMNDKCYLYHPITNCFEYAFVNNNKELIDLIKILIPDSKKDLQNIMNHAVKYKDYDIIDCLILKYKTCCRSEIHIHPVCDLDVLKYLIKRYNFNPERSKFEPTNKEVCLYLYENKLLYTSKHWPKICYQDTKIFELLLKDGIIQRNFKEHLQMLLGLGTLECLTLFIKRYPSEYNIYAKKAISISVHNHELFKFIINYNDIDLSRISAEIIKKLYRNALENATLETIAYIFPYLNHNIESFCDDLILALDFSRMDVCDFILDKVNHFPSSQSINLINYILTRKYYCNCNLNVILSCDSLIWLHNKIPESIKWQEVLLTNGSIYDIIYPQHMALLYFALKDSYKHRVPIDGECGFFERNRKSYVYRHHIKLYKALQALA